MIKLNILPKKYENSMNKKYSVLVVSCDKYESLWPAFFERFFKYWPTPYPTIYLVTNNKNATFDNVTTLMVGNENNWSKGLADALAMINDEYVYLLLDDIFIDEVVKEERLELLAKFCQKNNAGYLNTKGTPYPRGKDMGDKIKEITIGSHYRASLCNAFWKRSTLEFLLKDGESPWQFEINGTKRAEVLDSFYGTTDELIKYKHVVVGGKLAVKLGKNEKNISRIKERFTEMSFANKIIFYVSRLRSRVFCLIIPQTYQTRIRDLLG